MFGFLFGSRLNIYKFNEHALVYIETFLPRSRIAIIVRELSITNANLNDQ